MAQLQAAIEHLAEQISELRLDVAAVIRFLRLEQEAEVLAAVETVDEVYRQSRVTGVVGGVGWDRIVELEQPLQRLHRQIIGELQSVAQLARYTTIEQAKEVLRVDTERVDNLIALEQHILTALSRWTQLMLLARLERDELHPSAAQYARDRLLRRVQEAHATIRDLATADGGQVHGRSLWDRLRSDGLIGGALKDDKTREDAKVIRHKLHNVASRHQRFDLESASRPRLELVA